MKVITQIQHRRLRLPDLDLLENLYSGEFVFAKLVDTSDLVIRSTGPAVSGDDPTAGIAGTKPLDSRFRGNDGSIEVDSRPAFARMTGNDVISARCVTFALAVIPAKACPRGSGGRRSISVGGSRNSRYGVPKKLMHVPPADMPPDQE